LAYRQLHQTGQAAGFPATYLDGILLLALQVTLGGGGGEFTLGGGGG
jgi:hypothetical protein